MSSMDITSLTTPDKQFDYLLTMMSKLESKVNEKIGSTSQANNTKVTELEAKMVSLNSKFDDMQTKFIAHKLKADKIDDFSIFITKATDQLTSHDIKLKNTANELSEFQYKFDKLFVNNLTVPGFIGDQCQYKTMREYLEYNIKKLTSLITFKDKTNLDVKQYKEKMEGLIKDFERQTKTFSSIQNNHFEDLHKEINVQIEDLRKEFFTKWDELSMENSKYAIDLRDKAENIQFEWEKMNTFKDDLLKKFEGTVKEMKEDNGHAVQMVSGYKKEFQKMKEKLVDLIEFIKDVRFRRNLVAFDVVKKKEVANLNEKVLYGQKSRDDHYSYTRNLDLNYELFDSKAIKDYILEEDEMVRDKDKDKDRDRERKEKDSSPKDKEVRTQFKSMSKEKTKEPEGSYSTRAKYSKQLTQQDPKRKDKDKDIDIEKDKDKEESQQRDIKPIIGNKSASKKFSSSDNIPKVMFNRGAQVKKTNPLTQSVSKPVDNPVVTLQIFNVASTGVDGQETFDACITSSSAKPGKREGKRFRTTKENTQEIKSMLSKGINQASASRFNTKSSLNFADVKTKEIIDCSPSAKKPEKVDKLIFKEPNNINTVTEEDISKSLEQFKISKENK